MNKHFILLLILSFASSSAFAQMKRIDYETKDQPTAKEKPVAHWETNRPSKPATFDFRHFQSMESPAPSNSIQLISNNDGANIYVRGKASKANWNRNKPYDFVSYLSDVESELGIDPATELFKLTESIDEYGIVHIRLQQTLKDVPVYQGHLICHGSEGHLLSANGNLIYHNMRDEDVIPVIDIAFAKAVSNKHLSHLSHFKPNIDLPEDVELEDVIELVIYRHPETQKVVLAWHVTTKPKYHGAVGSICRCQNR